MGIETPESKWGPSRHPEAERSQLAEAALGRTKYASELLKLQTQADVFTGGNLLGQENWTDPNGEMHQTNIFERQLGDWKISWNVEKSDTGAVRNPIWTAETADLHLTLQGGVVLFGTGANGQPLPAEALTAAHQQMQTAVQAA